MCCRKMDPIQGPNRGSSLTLRNELTHMLTKQKTLLGRGAQTESSRVRKPWRTALLGDLQSWVLQGRRDGRNTQKNLLKRSA